MNGLQKAATELDDAIRDLYRVFRPYRARFPLEACDHCVDESHQRQIAGRPLEELSSEDLSYYAFKAMTTFGTVNDFKHFLPRILELTVRDRDFMVDCEVVYGKLPYASWREWPAMEQRTVEQFLWAMWRHELASLDAAMAIDVCLGCLAGVIESLTEFLGYWTEAMDRSSVARIRMAEFVRDQFPVGDEPLPFWEESRNQQKELLSWLGRDDTATRVRRALSEWTATAEGKEYGYYVVEKYEDWRMRRTV